MSEDLGKLRDAIDLIDREVLVALARRMQLSDKVIAAKDGTAAFRPGREAQLVRQLVAACRDLELDLAPTVVLGIWRQIMAASLSRQNDGLTCMVHPDALAAAVWHMGGMVDVEHTADLTTWAWSIGRRILPLRAGACDHRRFWLLSWRLMTGFILWREHRFLTCQRYHPPLSSQITFLIRLVMTSVCFYLRLVSATLDIVAVDGYHDAVPHNLIGAKLVGIYAR